MFKKFHIPVILFFLSVQLHVQAQEDVNLFDYWKFNSDVENSMYKSSCALAFDQLAERKEAIAKLNSKNDFVLRQKLVKEKLTRLIGTFPEKTPLNARVTGVIKKEDYKVEKVIYESIPGYYITAALFVPNKRKGKAPAVIYASGHTENGFRSETYQHVIINLVKKGFVVLAFDPVGQGERLQYYDEKEGKSRFGPTSEHSYSGAQCYISGYSVTKYFVWDGIRSVDYLLTRKEVDPERIGMTGRSGGGTQTAFTAAVDERILASAPECFITSMEYVLKSIGPQDAEQNIIHMIGEGLDHADLLEVRAPKPGIMITTTRDFFSIQGARETYREVAQFYQGMGSEEQISMVEDDDIHKSTKKNREAMYAFFQNSLDNPGDPSDFEVEIFAEKELWATETGQLATSLKGETVYSLNKVVVEKQVAELQSSRNNSEAHISGVANSAAALSGFEYPKNFGDPVFSGRYVKEKYILEKYLIPGSGDYMLPAALFRPLENRKKEVILFLDALGMEHAANENELLHSLLEQGSSVLLFDVPGIGSMGPGYLKGDAYIDNTSFNQWFAGILTNKSIVGMRVQDIIRLAHFAGTDIEDVETISALALGSTGSEILHAAVFDDAIQKLCLVQPFISFADIALSPDYSASFITSTVAGAINSYDLADLMASFCPRKLLIIDPQNSNGEPALESEVNRELAYPKDQYMRKNADENFMYTFDVDNLSSEEKVIQWLD